jgi:hypothetical protein
VSSTDASIPVIAPDATWGRVMSMRSQLRSHATIWDQPTRSNEVGLDTSGTKHYGGLVHSWQAGPTSSGVLDKTSEAKVSKR